MKITILYLTEHVTISVPGVRLMMTYKPLNSFTEGIDACGQANMNMLTLDKLKASDITEVIVYFLAQNMADGAYVADTSLVYLYYFFQKIMLLTYDQEFA
jgi:hypothetical protein